MSQNNKKNRQSGQSTVEFALTLTLVLGFILFFFQLSLVLGFSNYAQYATFMAARAYLSSGPDQGDQEARARTVINEMLKKGENSPGQDRFPTIAKGDGGGVGTNGLNFDASQYNPKNRNFSWLQGIRYTFKGRIFLLPFGKGVPANAGDQSSVTLTSESFLGRETSVQECVQEMKNRDGGIFDNGC